jgi:enoyl-CoA hydratase/carnithine racemase
VDYKTLLYKVEDAVGTLTLNVPDKLNAHGKQMRHELLHFWRQRQNDEGSCRAIILTGAGKAFCAGADLNEMNVSCSIEDIYVRTDEMSEVILLMRRAPQPIIGVVRGWAAGGGFSLALATDIRIVDTTARFLPSFINIGLSGGDMGSTYHLPRQIGLGIASQRLYTGDFIDGETAWNLGLANYLLPEEQMMGKARELAAKMVKKSVLGLRLTKEAINQAMGSASLDAVLHLENRNQAICRGGRPLENPFKKRNKRVENSH